MLVLGTWPLPWLINHDHLLKILANWCLLKLWIIRRPRIESKQRSLIVGKNEIWILIAHREIWTQQFQIIFPNCLNTKQFGLLLMLPPFCVRWYQTMVIIAGCPEQVGMWEESNPRLLVMSWLLKPLDHLYVWANSTTSFIFLFNSNQFFSSNLFFKVWVKLWRLHLSQQIWKQDEE